MKSENKILILKVLARNILILQLLITIGFAVPFYVVFTSNTDIAIAQYITSFSGFICFSLGCILISSITAIIFEIIEFYVLNNLLGIALKIAFSVTLILVCAFIGAHYKIF